MVEKIKVCGVCFSQVANDSLQVCQHCNASLSYSRLATVVDAEKLKSHYDNKTIDRKIIESLSPQENKPFPWNKVSIIVLALIGVFWIYNKVWVDKSFLDKNQIPVKISNQMIEIVESDCNRNRETCKNIQVKCSESIDASPADIENHIKAKYKITLSLISCAGVDCNEDWLDNEVNMAITVLDADYTYTTSNENFSYKYIYRDVCKLKTTKDE